MGKQYDADFKQQAVHLALAQAPEKPAAAIARELGVPKSTLYQWMEAVKTDPQQPFVGSGHLKAEDQAMHDLQRRVRDLEEENAILKKPANNGQAPIWSHNSRRLRGV